MSRIKSIISVLIIIFLLSGCTSSDNAVTAKENKNIRQISKEQKLYELSVIWKELSYNFASMDNCPLVNLDSLYRAYIPLIQKTKNDFEYCKTMLRFVANFNNGHTNVRDIPLYLDSYIARFYLETTYKNDKIIVENIGKEYANEIQIGDEITHINGINALEYFEKNLVPYINASNEKVKIHQAMFNKSGLAHLFEKNTKLTLTVKSEKNIKKVDIYANHEFSPNNSTKANWFIEKDEKTDKKSKNRQVMVDTVNSFMYVRLLFCDENFYSFFKENNNEINKYQHLIIDLSDNQGGNLYYDYSLHFLFNKDTLLDLISATKVNRAACKARGKAVCDNPDFQQKITPYCLSCCDYYKGTFFERMPMNNVPNFALETQRYKGNIYVVANRNTASAAEGFVIAFSQNANVSIIGEKTAGAIGQPYMISLPSGLVVTINTDKTYNYKGNEVSSGFPPDYEYDFSEIHKIKDPQEMLSNFIKVIKELEKK